VVEIPVGTISPTNDDGAEILGRRITGSIKYTWVAVPQTQQVVVSLTFKIGQFELRFRLWPKTGGGSGSHATVFVEFRRSAAASTSDVQPLSDAVVTIEYAGGKKTTAST